jgi:hypothetical protein
METLWFIVLTGTGATALLDLWALVRRRLLGVPLPNFGLVGRWVAHLARGRVRHASMAAAAVVRGELALGWIAHYLIGIAFAALPIAFWSREWARHPTLGPALIVGIGTVAVPFFIIQPAMGLGFAGRRLPRPAATRMQGIISHAVFGLGLYVAAVGLAYLLN